MNKEELLKFSLGLLSKSGISDEDYDMWQNNLHLANIDLLRMIADTVSQGNEVIEMATKSLKEKMAVVDDSEKLNNIIESEKDEIKNILNED